METRNRRALFWAPRVLALGFVAFLALFALDVFGEGYSFGETLFALFMHLIPNFVILGAVMLAWRNDRLGAILFLGMGLLFLGMSRGTGWFVSGPLILIAALYLVSASAVPGPKPQ